jgi:hypothetical protein
MKQVLTQSDVAKAISDLLAQGKKPTMAAIHAAVGGNGSMSTLHRIKAEIDAMAQTQPANDSPEAQQAFRTIWNLAVDQGRKQSEAIVAELRDNIRALAVENERQEGDATLWQSRAIELEKSQARAEADRQAAQSALCEASGQAARALQQLADVLDVPTRAGISAGSFGPRRQTRKVKKLEPGDPQGFVGQAKGCLRT